MNIYISGSMAYDRIMDFPGKFSDHILPDKIHILNVCFTVNGMVEKFGGTAGNIAYSLSLLRERPLILATIGKDYDRYYAWLQKNKISVDGIRIIRDEFTAGAYITTDKADNQITGFNPGSMKCPPCPREPPGYD
jgi:adenosine kinase